MKIRDYAETVLSRNNENIHRLRNFYIDNALADLGYTEDVSLLKPLDFSLDIAPFRNAEKIISLQLENELVRFTFHNRLVLRGRLSSLHVSILNNLAEENGLLIDQIEDQLVKNK